MTCDVITIKIKIHDKKLKFPSDILLYYSYLQSKALCIPVKCTGTLA